MDDPAWTAGVLHYAGHPTGYTPAPVSRPYGWCVLLHWCVQGCPRFDHLCLTGGAIGSGPPMSVGAAVAAPQRQVINLQADGSAMYTLQVGGASMSLNI